MRFRLGQITQAFLQDILCCTYLCLVNFFLQWSAWMARSQ
jgi:hypothetical protein